MRIKKLQIFSITTQKTIHEFSFLKVNILLICFLSSEVTVSYKKCIKTTDI